jgi:hypothetical protein
MRVGAFIRSHSMRPLGLILPLSSLHLALAITLPIRGFRSDSSHLSKRSNLTGISVKNGGNVIYGADINLGGNNFSVVLDTGRHVYPRSLPPFLTYPISALTSGWLVLFQTLTTRESRSQ